MQISKVEIFDSNLTRVGGISLQKNTLNLVRFNSSEDRGLFWQLIYFCLYPHYNGVLNAYGKVKYGYIVKIVCSEGEINFSFYREYSKNSRQRKCFSKQNAVSNDKVITLSEKNELEYQRNLSRCLSDFSHKDVSVNGSELLKLSYVSAYSLLSPQAIVDSDISQLRFALPRLLHPKLDLTFTDVKSQNRIKKIYTNSAERYESELSHLRPYILDLFRSSFELELLKPRLVETLSLLNEKEFSDKIDGFATIYLHQELRYSIVQNSLILSSFKENFEHSKVINQFLKHPVKNLDDYLKGLEDQDLILWLRKLVTLSQVAQLVHMCDLHIENYSGLDVGDTPKVKKTKLNDYKKIKDYLYSESNPFTYEITRLLRNINVLDNKHICSLNEYNYKLVIRESYSKEMASELNTFHSNMMNACSKALGFIVLHDCLLKNKLSGYPKSSFLIFDGLSKGFGNENEESVLKLLLNEIYKFLSINQSALQVILLESDDLEPLGFVGELGGVVCNFEFDGVLNEA